FPNTSFSPEPDLFSKKKREPWTGPKGREQSSEPWQTPPRKPTDPDETTPQRGEALASGQRRRSDGVLLDSWDEFVDRSVQLFRADPITTRYCMKYRHCDGKLVLKVTDDREVLEV
uniref:SRP9 domain-containing protein n=1 Tax=Aegilops tauschii subsp. strangulata TaxID=200361 RepID=A0A453RAM6_AEGTS